MKSILLISRCPPYPLHLGDRLISWHLTRELAERGYTIDLLALYDRADDPVWIDHYRDRFRHIKLIPEPRRGGDSYLRRLLNPADRFARTAEMSFSPELWRAIADCLERNDYDVVHCFGSVSVYEFHPLLAHRPNLIMPYESYALYLASAARQSQISARLRLPIARRFESWMYTPFDRTVVIAEKDRQMLLSLQPELKVDVIPIGIEPDRFHYSDTNRAKDTLLFLGNYEYRPNLDAARVLVQLIMPQIWRELPGTKLQLVGNNPADWMQALNDERIEVTGRVPEVQPYLAQATAFVSPLRIGAGIKNKVLEALATGIPLVATPLSLDGIEVSQGDSAIVAEVNGFAAATLALLRDEKLRLKLSRRGRELVEAQYTWGQTATRFEQLYDEIARG